MHGLPPSGRLSRAAQSCGRHEVVHPAGARGAGWERERTVPRGVPGCRVPRPVEPARSPTATAATPSPRSHGRGRWRPPACTTGSARCCSRSTRARRRARPASRRRSPVATWSIDPARMRNLFDETATRTGSGGVAARRRASRASRTPRWSTAPIPDAAGDRCVGLPVIIGRPRLAHHDSTGRGVRRDAAASAGVVDGFGALYRAWLEHVVEACAPVLRTARRGRLRVPPARRAAGRDWDDPALRLVHAIHTIHLEPPVHPGRSAEPARGRAGSRSPSASTPCSGRPQRSATTSRTLRASPVHVVVPHAGAARRHPSRRSPSAPGPDRDAEPARSRQAHRPRDPRARGGARSVPRRDARHLRRRSRSASELQRLIDELGLADARRAARA